MKALLPKVRVYLSGSDGDPASIIYVIYNVIDRIFHDFGVRLEIDSVEPRPPWDFRSLTAAGGLGSADPVQVDYGDVSFLEFAGRRVELSVADEDLIYSVIVDALADLLDFSVAAVDQGIDALKGGREPPPHFSAPVYIIEDPAISVEAAS